jgi:hypothetical protein
MTGQGRRAVGGSGAEPPIALSSEQPRRRMASRCTCNCRAMVPTRHFSTVCRRRICATRSGAMVMAPSPLKAVAQEARTHRCALAGVAAATGPARDAGGRWRGDAGLWRGNGCRAVGCDRAGDAGGGAVVCPCRQRSRSHPQPGTLVRHVLWVDPCSDDGITGRTTLAPTPRALRVADAATPGALVALCACLRACWRQARPQ